MKWELLGGLNEGEVRSVLARMVRRRYRKGEVVFHEGDPGDTVHLLTKGRVAVRVSTLRGEVVTLNLLGPGSSFGELALVFEDSRRSATIVAVEPVETLMLGRADFVDLCKRNPAVEGALIRALGLSVRRLSEAVRDALFLPADKRVLRRLLDLVALYTGDVDGEVTIPLTQDDLASMAGTTRPTANRVLQDLASRGWLTLARGRITVTDAEAIRRRARM